MPGTSLLESSEGPVASPLGYREKGKMQLTGLRPEFWLQYFAKKWSLVSCGRCRGLCQVEVERGNWVLGSPQGGTRRKKRRRPQK